MLNDKDQRKKSLLLEIEAHKDFFNNSADGVYVVDTERIIMYWNKAAERITGYSWDEMVDDGCYNQKLRHQDEGGHELCVGLCPLVKTMFDEKVRNHNVTYLHKDGTRRPCTVEVHPIKSGDLVVGAYEIFKLV